MRGILSKILVLIGVICFYFLIKELLYLYNVLSDFHPYAVYIGFGATGLFLIYFAGIPLFQLLVVNVAPGPVLDQTKVDGLIVARMKKFRNNSYLKEIGFDFSGISDDKQGYEQTVAVLSEEAGRIRESYVRTIFYATATAQNGFLDGLIILSANIKMIKSIFVLYNGRVSTRELLKIGNMVVFAVVAGGSEGAEYATEELVSKLGSDVMKSIPFIDKLMSSVMDGYINAMLLTRVSLITENYCKMTYIKKESDLRPGSVVVMHTADMLLHEAYKDVRKFIKKRVTLFGESDSRRKKVQLQLERLKGYSIGMDVNGLDKIVIEPYLGLFVEALDRLVYVSGIPAFDQVDRKVTAWPKIEKRQNGFQFVLGGITSAHARSALLMAEIREVKIIQPSDKGAQFRLDIHLNNDHVIQFAFAEKRKLKVTQFFKKIPEKVFILS